MVDENKDFRAIISPYDYQHSLQNKIHSRRFKHENLFKRNSYLEKLDDRRLRSAASTNNVERLNELLESGINPNSADENGRTALHFACCRGYQEVVKSLLAHHANCNAIDKLGNTPLHLAVCTTSKETIDLLLQAGCSVTAKGNNGCTPLQLAQSKLWLLQKTSMMRGNSPEYNALKSQVSEVIEMMKKLVQVESEEAKLVENFRQRLNLVSSSEQVADDVKQLLNNLNEVSISNPFNQAVS